MYKELQELNMKVSALAMQLETAQKQNHALSRQVAELKNKAEHYIRIGQTTMPINESSGVQTVQIQHNEFETHSDISMSQHFGFTSSAPTGSAILALSLGGDASRKMVVSTHNASLRPTNTPAGGTVLYDQSATQVSLPNNGTCVININGVGILTINNQGISVNGKITSTGDIQSTEGDIISSTGVELERHTHPYNPGSGASTQTGTPSG